MRRREDSNRTALESCGDGSSANSQVAWLAEFFRGLGLERSRCLVPCHLLRLSHSAGQAHVVQKCCPLPLRRQNGFLQDEGIACIERPAKLTFKRTGRHVSDCQCRSTEMTGGFRPCGFDGGQMEFARLLLHAIKKNRPATTLVEIAVPYANQQDWVESLRDWPKIGTLWCNGDRMD